MAGEPDAGPIREPADGSMDRGTGAPQPAPSRLSPAVDPPGPQLAEDVVVRMYREGTSGLTAMVSETDAVAMARIGFVAMTRTWEGTSLTVIYQRRPGRAIDVAAEHAAAQPAREAARHAIGAIIRAVLR
jgi:hypothetical protein